MKNVALVTGASRGVGKGVALSLADIGMKVYVTGRTAAGRNSLERTVAEIESRGGSGIPLVCDHSDDAAVANAIQTIANENDALDLLVNNVWGGNEATSETGPFWEHSMSGWSSMIDLGVRAHLVTTKNSVELLRKSSQPLIVTVSFWDNEKYAHTLVYDIALNAMNRLAFGLGAELKDLRIPSVALSPGFVRTERVLEAYRETPELADEFGGIELTESVEYTGRAIASLWQDTQVMRWTGRALAVGDLAREYGFTDLDGARPKRFVLPEFRPRTSTNRRSG